MGMRIPSKSGSDRRKRQSVRFKPDADEIAQVELELRNGPFRPSTWGLVFEEAAKGCGLVILIKEAPQVGQVVRVKVGKLSPLRAEVRWVKALDSEIYRIGLMYLE